MVWSCRISPIIANAIRAKATLDCRFTGGRNPGVLPAKPGSAIFALLNSIAQLLLNNKHAQQSIKSSRPDTRGLGYWGICATAGIRTEAPANIRPRTYRVPGQ